MDLSAAQHHLHHHYLNHHQQQQEQQQQQEMDSQSLDSMISCSKQSIMDSHQEKNPNSNSNSNGSNLKPRPADNEAQKCPRCDSTNTKFCYYNNYSLSQPRYFCKGCRRYWTKGGTLRNVPVGGGCRKSAHGKRPSSPNSSFILKRAHTHDVTPNIPPPSNPAGPFYGGGGYASLTDCDGLLPNPQAFGFLDSLRHGNGGLFQSLCYGAGDAIHMPFDDVAAGVGAGNAVMTMKQENERRALWGFPWHGEGTVAADVEPIRGSTWNGLIGNSAWQGLLNSPALI